ncbi:MAG: AAA family ATPase [Chitinophagales bacterium]|nr:AAA family ATPase [Chitinophagales bacterium]
MNALKETFKDALGKTNVTFLRSYIDAISWDSRLIGIKGPRGVGKTTLLLQYIKTHLKDQLGQTLYVSLDNVYFYKNTILDLATIFYKSGGKHLFLDEVHKYPRWAVEIKNIYDMYPDLRVVFTGSSMLEILNAQADLSRRVMIYHMQGLSYREYLCIKLQKDLPTYSLSDILSNHENITMDLSALFSPLQHFDAYLSSGYYPFFLENDSDYLQRLRQVIELILEIELPNLRNVSVRSVFQLKQLMSILADSVPFTPNISKLSGILSINRETLVNYLYYLKEAGLARPVHQYSSHISKLQKPDKLLLDNTNIQYALSLSDANTGTLRETFFANQLSAKHQVHLSDYADYLIDNKYHFEIGGANKTKKQIKGQSDAYVVKDQIVHGHSNVVPLWLFGFLY